MNRNFIFAFILLVTVSIVNASPLQPRGETQFKICEGYPPDSTPDLLTVKLTPDPIQPGEQTFEVSITLQNYTIDQATSVNIYLADAVSNVGLMYYSMDLCSESDCPVEPKSKAGSPYSTTQTMTIPAKLPSKYTINVQHFINLPDATIPYSCAFASVG